MKKGIAQPKRLLSPRSWPFIHLCVAQTYPESLIGNLQTKEGQGRVEGVEGLQNIRVNQVDKHDTILLRVAFAVNDPHLLHNGTLATLSRA